MTKYSLIRFCRSELGTFGVLIKNNAPVCVTLEPVNPIIPPGTFTARKFESPHFVRTVFRFDNIPGHDAVEIHMGNTILDTHGCILVGTCFNNDGIKNSGDALSYLLSISDSEISVCVNDIK